MWNAYKTSNEALTGRDIRVSNMQVDGLLTLNFSPITLTLTEEDGTTTESLNCFYSKIGRIITLVIPQTSTFSGTFTNHYKVIGLPSSIAAGPVSGKGETQIIFAEQNGVSGAGVAIINSSSELQLYPLVSKGAPVASSRIQTFQFSYKSAN